MQGPQVPAPLCALRAPAPSGGLSISLQERELEGRTIRL